MSGRKVEVFMRQSCRWCLHTAIALLRTGRPITVVDRTCLLFGVHQSEHVDLGHSAHILIRLSSLQLGSLVKRQWAHSAVKLVVRYGDSVTSRSVSPIQR